MAAPILSVIAAATGDSEGLWAHLFATVLPRYVANTLALMAGVGGLSLALGVSTAWVVTRYEFPGRRVLEWMLVLPFAVPAYLIAYVYTDFLDYAGPVQGALRDAFGWESRRDYWFPEIRSMWGAIVVMGMVLYPYVYMMTRTAFKLTPHTLFEIARIHDRGLFRTVGLPLARPAIVAGLALVLMETVSDFGTVDYFALETLTLGIFNVWLGMNSLPAAAQIASLAFLFVIAMLVLELRARRGRRYVDTGRRMRSLARLRAGPAGSAACLAVCLLPVTVGFLIPVGVLLSFVAKGHALPDYGDVLAVTLNSVVVALAVAALVMGVAAMMVVTVAYRPSRPLQALAGIASSGYAFPGTILAIGVVTFAGAVDRGLDGLISGAMGLSFEGFLTGGLGLVLFACIGALPGDRLRRADGGHEPAAARHGGGRPRAGPGPPRQPPPRDNPAARHLLPRRRAAGLRRRDEGAADDAPAPPLRLRHTRHPPLPVRQGRALGAGGGPRPPHRPRRHRPRHPDERSPPPPRRGREGEQERGVAEQSQFLKMYTGIGNLSGALHGLFSPADSTPNLSEE